MVTHMGAEADAQLSLGSADDLAGRDRAMQLVVRESGPDCWEFLRAPAHLTIRTYLVPEDAGDRLTAFRTRSGGRGTSTKDRR